jgi:hypothetical protein
MLVWFKGDDALPLVYKGDCYTCVSLSYPHYSRNKYNLSRLKDKITNIGPKEISRWED